MPTITPFSDEQSRLIVNLHMRYDSWMAAERDLAAMPYDLRRKRVNGRDYLYRIFDRGGNGTSLGPMGPENAELFEEYHSSKDALQDRLGTLRPVLAEASALYRALRLPLLSSDAGPILRECDRRSLLGSHLLVIGTNAMAAYSIEANGRIDVPDETEDFDLAWVAPSLDDQASEDHERLVWDMLKAVDPTFAINSERDFQARNAKAYEVELLVAPSRVGTLAPKDQPRPLPLPEQEWLLLGRPVDQVIGCRDGSPARIIAPDPRWFALHKLWLSEQPKRNALKRTKDRAQGIALLDAVAEAMPHYPIDDAFEAHLPDELGKCIVGWKKQRSKGPAPLW